jgi:hypothetical protein
LPYWLTFLCFFRWNQAHIRALPSSSANECFYYL